ncbi:MAG TPA: BamA/TamA family outer membrane protein, partial [Candidatus Eisenbacteria bacterium]
LSLHLERGAKRSDYYLSFTEPWFRDTPTLLGFSLFNTDRERDLYNEKRRGGSVRIGRPLPWPDYSRGSLSYSLEGVTIDTTGRGSSVGQSAIILAGVPNGRAVLTSSVNGNFLRNSTNNPFYPTQGSRFSIETELAGGPFGGSVNFHKHRIEGRVYLPSLLKRMTTMVRARVGIMGEYADQHLPSPLYERFRLGGGTTADPLRGYDDYMVVPKKFIRDVVASIVTTMHIDSVSTPGVFDTTFSSDTTRTLVRYPGGRFMTLYTIEQQFPIAHPLHGVVFFDAGNTWDLIREVRPFDLKLGAGVGLRIEIPLLGNIGFDYGYGFNRDDGPRFVGHFLIGQTSF